jgi:2-polyprenyl-3-methyl-5-hydroxy-6-metoxy-1,4-benzoquinol methylase
MAFERIEPDTPDWIAFVANHEHRYRFVAELLDHLGPASRVLDAATGVGYGAALLADRTGGHVVGIDRDDRALALARARFARPRVEYLLDDCNTLVRAGAGRPPYDAVVSLETIEHLPDPRLFLDRAARLLAPGGLLIVSTPNGSQSKGDPNLWAAHEREYAATEFVALLEAASFRSIQLFGQRLAPMGELRRDVRGEINLLRFNPLARLGFWIQNRVRGFRPPPPLPEQISDFEIVPIHSASACEQLGKAGPLVLIASALTPTVED